MLVHTPVSLLLPPLLLPFPLASLLLLLQVLIEAGQRLPDGRMRQRSLPLSEKMIGAEGWQAAAVRAVSEELATVLPQEWKCQVSRSRCCCCCWGMGWGLSPG